MIGIFSTPISIYNNKDIVEDIKKYILEKSNQQNTNIEKKCERFLIFPFLILTITLYTCIPMTY